MSNTTTIDQDTTTKTKPRRLGNAPSTTPSIGKGARNLDPDINPWEQQPGETKLAYDTFCDFRDSDERKVTAHGPSAQKWSSYWSWGYRAFEYDRWLARKDAEDMVRYRRKMNDRQRKIAAAAQQKIIQWLAQLDVRSLSAGEAARWLEVAVKVERLAGGAESERLAIAAQGPVVENMSAEEVSEALAALSTQIQAMVQP